MSCIVNYCSLNIAFCRSAGVGEWVWGVGSVWELMREISPVVFVPWTDICRFRHILPPSESLGDIVTKNTTQEPPPPWFVLPNRKWYGVLMGHQCVFVKTTFMVTFSFFQSLTPVWHYLGDTRELRGCLALVIISVSISAHRWNFTLTWNMTEKTDNSLEISYFFVCNFSVFFLTCRSELLQTIVPLLMSYCGPPAINIAAWWWWSQ